LTGEIDGSTETDSDAIGLRERLRVLGNRIEQPLRTALAICWSRFAEFQRIAVEHRDGKFGTADVNCQPVAHRE